MALEEQRKRSIQQLEVAEKHKMTEIISVMNQATHFFALDCEKIFRHIGDPMYVLNTVDAGTCDSREIRSIYHSQ